MAITQARHHFFMFLTSTLPVNSPIVHYNDTRQRAIIVTFWGEMQYAHSDSSMFSFTCRLSAGLPTDALHNAIYTKGRDLPVAKLFRRAAFKELCLSSPAAASPGNSVLAYDFFRFLRRPRIARPGYVRAFPLARKPGCPFRARLFALVAKRRRLAYGPPLLNVAQRRSFCRRGIRNGSGVDVVLGMAQVSTWY